MSAFSLKDVQILVVDDDSEYLNSLCSLISGYGFTVHSAGDAYSAFHITETLPIDLVLADIQMPKLNGVDFLRMLRVGNADRPKFLFMSGHADYRVEELYALGGEGFFAKPFEIKSLRNAIRLTLLRREERWKVDPTRISDKLAVLDEVFLGQNRIQLGRGGFLVAFDRHPQIRVNTEIKFSVNYKPNMRIEGLGIARWIGSNGVGVEILELWGDCREVVVKEIDSTLPISYIPMK